MRIKRRAFNVLLGGTSLSLIFPTISKGDNYTGPVNWAGISFLLPFNQIEKLMPVTKVASEINSDIDNATFFNSYLNQSLKNIPIPNINLKLEGFAENAKLALTYGFSAEFDFGEFKDNEVGKTAYLMYSFGQSLLYNVYDRVIISSVPITKDMLQERRVVATNISYKCIEEYVKASLEAIKAMQELVIRHHSISRVPADVDQLCLFLKNFLWQHVY